MRVSPDPFKHSVGSLKQVDREYRTVRRLVDEFLGREDIGADARKRAEEVLAASELTYLLRLFAAFESGLVAIGPSLKTPLAFGRKDTLGTKLDRIASAMSMNSVFKNEIDQDVRDLRNELIHGRSLVPRLPFDHVMNLMRQFVRGCH